MASIDDRVVAMQFDNAAFEQKIAATIASLDKLKGSLDFANAKRGMADLTTAGHNFNLHGMGSAVEDIASKFTAMGAVAFTVISNIVNRAVDAGIKLGKALSLDQVISGFHEYETNMNSIQTILANTKSDATTLDDVNKALDQLNTYSDQTIYNFSQMAKNIGTFTAAGVDLDTSVGAIKGIANLAAVSGSSAEQASGAMYQLSQAIATGTLRIIDWNSVTNAGMGGEVFQKSLFETGKALKTLKGVEMGTTFEEWTSGGNSFRSSLEQNWLTSEVLTTTLQGFTGDMTEAQLLSMGYTAEQAAGILEMGITAKNAATEVKTLTQLFGTVKESIGSGWSQTFRTIFGDFEEAKSLFTLINTTIGNIVGASADSRNELLKGWKDMGGRTALIHSLIFAFQGLVSILKPIKEAFRDIFPAMTAKRLFDLTERFRDFMQKLTLSEETAANVKRVFKGLFAAFDIGWSVVKGIAGVFGDLFHHFVGVKSGGALEFLANLGDKIVSLREKFVNSGAIFHFFERLTPKIRVFVEQARIRLNEFKDKLIEVFNYIEEVVIPKVKKFVESLDLGPKFEKVVGILGRVKDGISGVFDNFDVTVPNSVSDALGRVGERFGWLTGLGHILAGVWDWISDRFGAIRTALGGFVDFMQEKFAGLPQKIADALSNTDYNQVLDTVNTGLFAGLILMFSRLGKSLNIGGIFTNIGKTITELTNTLEAMQLKLKAEALMAIAKAIGLLTISMVVLSLMDSAALTKSLVAVGVGVGILVTAMGLLNTITSGPGGAAKLVSLSASLILISAAILILSFAAKSLSGLDWDELSKGLIGVLGLLVSMVSSVEILSENSDGMIRAGIGMIAISIALNIMALAVKSFAEMDWVDMGKGMTGVALSLGALVAAVKLMPTDLKMISAGLGMIAISVALNIIALAVKSFAEMDWADMAKGMVGVAIGLQLIVVAMDQMPKGMILQGLGIAAIGFGLVQIAKAVQSLGSMSWGDMTRGLTGIAGALLVLAGAAYIMEGAIPGAIAIGIISLSLGQLADGVKKFADMSWSDLLKGMAELAIVLVVLAAAGLLMGPIIPILGLLGVALLLVGAGFALFGLGASLVATAFAVLATSGAAGVAVLLSAVGGLIKLLPALIVAIGDGLIQLVGKIIEVAPDIISGLGDIIGSLLQLLIDNIPKLAKTFKTFILEGLKVLKETIPEFIKTGFKILIAFLQGFRDNIGEIATLVAEIITNFLDALSLKVSEIIDSVYNFVVSVIKGVVAKLIDIGSYLLPKGVELAGGLLNGIIEKGIDIANWFLGLPGMILGWIGDVVGWLKDKGLNFVGGLLLGIAEKGLEVALWFTGLPGMILEWIGDVVTWLKEKGIGFIGGLINGIIEKALEVSAWFLGLPGKILSWIINAGTFLKDKGIAIIGGLLSGIIEKVMDITRWFFGLPAKILGWIGDALTWLLDTGVNLISGMLDGIVAGALFVMRWFIRLPGMVLEWVTDLAGTLYQVGRDVIDGLWQGMQDVWDSITDWLSNLNPTNWFNDINPKKGHAIKNLVGTGQQVMTGLRNGMEEGWDGVTKWLKTINPSDSVDMSISDRTVKSISSSLNSITDQLGNMDNFNPTITPVLDLTNVIKSAGKLGHILGSGSTLAAELSYSQASSISAASRPQEDELINATTTPTLKEIKFEQNNYSPEALSVADIYRQTRNQIAMAKEELAVL